MEDQTIFELIHLMEKTTNNMIIKWNQMFNENIGISHVLVLSHLNEHGKSRPSDLAERLGFAPPSITHLSEKLIKQKLAIRLRDEKDKRILYLDITDEGKKILKKAHQEGVTLRKQLFERLTEEERQQLIAIYLKLNEGW